ncbi:MAG: hypothetical protein ABWY56_00290 [Propionibacteriaceae bacterium]
MSTPSNQSLLDPPRVLFVGDDASSPQIAASLLHALSGDLTTVATASPQPGVPGGRADEMLVAMGLNPAEERRLTSGALYAADHVVVLSTTLDVARLPGPTYEEWDLAQDDLIERVHALNDALTATPEKPPRSAFAELVLRLWESVRRGTRSHV